MSKEAYLGLDIGGTGVKAGVFSHDGRLLGFSRRGFKPTVSPEGHADISINVIYKAAREAVREAVAASGARVVALAVSSQGETFVSLDENNRPLHDAIMWYDSRAEDEANALIRAVPSSAGWLNSLYSVCKIKWLQAHFPKIMRKARRFLLLPDYFAYRLAGQAITDPNIALSSGMTTAEGDEYDQKILDAAGIEASRLAKIMPSGTPIGHILESVAEEWGFAPETLMVAGTNDQYAGALGAGNCRPGILSETSGTCLAMVTLAKQKPVNLPAGLLSGRFPIPHLWFILAYSKTSGLVLDWFRETVAPDASFDELNKAAGKIAVGCKGLSMAPHFDGAISPAPNPKMRGAFIGLTLNHDRGHMYRSILEALTFNLVANLELIRSRGFKIEVIRAIGGGAKNPLWLQMKADATGLPVELPSVPEAATLGAAMLAACGRGDYQSLAEASGRLYHCGQIIKPVAERNRLYRLAFENHIRIMEQTASFYA